jgi:hypothetical protein
VAGKSLRKRRGGFAGSDRDPPLEIERPGVELRHDPHRDHAGLAIAAEDRGGDRRRPAVPRQKGCVDVDAAESRNVEHLVGKQLPVGNDRDGVRADRGEALEEGRVAAHALGLLDCETAVLRELAHRRRNRAAAPSHGPVRLRDHEGNLEPPAEKGLERG